MLLLLLQPRCVLQVLAAHAESFACRRTPTALGRRTGPRLRCCGNHPPAEQRQGLFVAPCYVRLVSLLGAASSAVAAAVAVAAVCRPA